MQNNATQRYLLTIIAPTGHGPVWQHVQHASSACAALCQAAATLAMPDLAARLCSLEVRQGEQWVAVR
jgi:hypothetical protein